MPTYLEIPRSRVPTSSGPKPANGFSDTQTLSEQHHHEKPDHEDGPARPDKSPQGKILHIQAAIIIFFPMPARLGGLLTFTDNRQRLRLRPRTNNLPDRGRVNTVAVPLRLYHQRRQIGKRTH